MWSPRGAKRTHPEMVIVRSASIDPIRFKRTLSTDTPGLLQVDVREKDVKCGEERPIEGVESRVEALIDCMYVDGGEISEGKR